VTAVDVAARVVLAVGVAVTVASALAMFTVRRVEDRLHYVTPVTSLGVPLIGAAIALDGGLSLASGEVILIVALQALTGAALASATGRLIGQREGLLSRESPE